MRGREERMESAVEEVEVEADETRGALASSSTYLTTCVYREHSYKVHLKGTKSV